MLRRTAWCLIQEVSVESATFDQLTARLTTRLSRRRSLALLGSLGIASTAMTEG